MHKSLLLEEKNYRDIKEKSDPIIKFHQNKRGNKFYKSQDRLSNSEDYSKEYLKLDTNYLIFNYKTDESPIHNSFEDTSPEDSSYVKKMKD